MARPTGRYFASVIAKIRDAKKKEIIVIDEGFKVQLRQQVMMKIAAQAAPVRTGWFERLAPLKSYFAVVPALGLVIVAVVGISKLPIDFGSKVVVPTASPSQESNEVQPFAQNSAGAEAVSGSGLKTFPGRSVLPPNYFQGDRTISAQSFDVQSLEANVAGPESTQPQQAEVSKKASTSPSPSTSAPVQQPVTPKTTETPVQQQPPVQYFSYQTPANNTSRVGEGNVKSPAQTVAPEVPSVSGSTPLAEVSVEAPAPSVTGETPSIPANSSLAPKTTQKSTEKVLLPSFVANPQITRKPLEVDKSSTFSSVPTNLTLNDIAALPAQHLGLNVLYEGRFSTDERTILEKNLLPNMVGNQEIDYIQVSQLDAATIVIELHFKDGNVSVFDYKVAENGTWQLVDSTLQRAAQQ